MKRHLEKNGVDYDERDLTKDPDKLAEFQDKGLTQAPVVESATRPTFTGFNPDALNQIVADERRDFDCGADGCCGGLNYPDCRPTE